MQELVASRTALGTSLMRALHTRADPLRIIDDPWGDRLVPAAAIEAIRQRALAAMSADARATAEGASEPIVDAWLRANAAYAAVITRSRFTEDALHAAVTRGVRQYVMIGAGFDSYALRRPADEQHVEIFEVDHPATQSLKKRRLSACAITVEGPVHFLAADLANEGLDTVLSRSSFRPDEPAFFSWLGVTMYLTRDANFASLRAIAQCGAAGSELVFTYLDQEVFRGDSASASDAFADLRRSVTSMGEPFLSAFDPTALEHDLREVGFELVEDLDDIRLVQRYDPLGANRLRAARRSHIARARVVSACARGGA
jgi:methyltransferase (TIGR00027 family)